MGLFDIVKQVSELVSDDELNIVSTNGRYDKKRKTLRQRATDNNGNTYMREMNPLMGILDERKISVLPGDKHEQAKQLKRQGYTQDEIADMLGVSQSTVSNWLRK